MGTTEETTITDRGGTTIPAEIRESLDIGGGDKLRWSVSDEGELTVEVVKQETGVFDDFEPMSLGGDGKTAHDTTGAER
jgi:AbrB family looped-hinge helix DNA binding protein